MNVSGFFNKLANFLKGDTEASPENEVQAPTESATTEAQGRSSEEEPKPRNAAKPQKQHAQDNPIDHSHKIVQAVTKFLKNNSKRKDIPVIWATNDYFQSIISAEGFMDTLRAEIANVGLIDMSTGKIDIRHAVPQPSDEAKDIFKGLVFVSFQQIKKVKAQPKRVVATISIYDNCGTLEQESYTLDSDVKKEYHIGRERLVTRNNMKRNNHIVVGSSEDSERNGYVSRVHATITYSPAGVFVLKADEGGCTSLGGRKTRIIKHDNIRDLVTTNSGVSLGDGDIIELGREDGVKLLYKIEN